MEILSFIVLILLSLVGYSAGVVVKSGKSVELKPQIIDLIVVSFIWAGGIFSRIALGLNKWFLIILWVIVSVSIGILAIWPRKLPKTNSLIISEYPETSKSSPKRLWQGWKNFSRRMGSFQTRIMLSLFFFLFVTPFGLAVKVLSDPLRIKRKRSGSYWLLKKERNLDLEEFKKQF